MEDGKDEAMRLALAIEFQPAIELQRFRFCSLQKTGSQVAFSLRKSHFACCRNVYM
jgi:hypothetical protein